MESILESKTNSKTNTPEQFVKIYEIKAASAPIVPLNSLDIHLKTQISAPSYFHSLKENDAPPFIKPDKEPKPRLLIGTIVKEDEAVGMIAAADFDKENGLRKFLGNFLVDKKIIANHNISEKNLLIGFLEETIDYVAQHEYSAFKLSVLLTIYLDTHLYFKWYYWQTSAAVWQYFKELMIRHTIQDSPDGQEVFEPQECYDIMSHFHTLYLANLPLVHIHTYGAYRLKFQWPFKPK